MVDRENRDRLVNAISDYLDERITAFEFDDQLTETHSSKDEVVIYTARNLWLFYDDLKDHKVVLAKEGWGFFQRFSLLLQSDACFETTRKRKYSLRQLVAAFSLLLFAMICIRLGLGYQTLAVVIPFGIISIMLSRWKGKTSKNTTEPDFTLYPFFSITEILRTRRTVPGFVKRPYPPHLKTRKIRSWAMSLIAPFNAYAGWLLFSPIVLFFQMFPDKYEVQRVVVPE